MTIDGDVAGGATHCAVRGDVVCDIGHDADERGGDPGWGGVRQGVDRQGDRGASVTTGVGRERCERCDRWDSIVGVCDCERARAVLCVCVRVGLNGLRSGAWARDVCGARGRARGRGREG